MTTSSSTQVPPARATSFGRPLDWYLRARCAIEVPPVLGPSEQALSLVTETRQSPICVSA
jgi:hypothetical protein